MAIGELDPDRFVVYYISHDSEWIILRAVAFHYTIFKTDILDILKICEVDVEPWIEFLLKQAQGAEYRPVPVAAKPQHLPSLQTLKDKVPLIISSEMAFPIFDGYKWGGFVLNPGGEPIIQQIPYTAALCDFTYYGLNFWGQSGMLNGAGILVSQADFHYRRITLPKIIYPLLNISEFFPGYGLYGADLWYSPNAQSHEQCADPETYANNSVQYVGSGLYNVNRGIFLDCPLPEIPEGHFLRPLPGMNNVEVFTELDHGRFRCGFHNKNFQIYGAELERTPFGCVPGWPPLSFLEPYGLDVYWPGINDVYVVQKADGSLCKYPGSLEEWGEGVVVPWGTDEPTGGEGGTKGLSMIAISTLPAVYRLLVRSGNAAILAIDEENDPLTIAGFKLEVE